MTNRTCTAAIILINLALFATLYFVIFPPQWKEPGLKYDMFNSTQVIENTFTKFAQGRPVITIRGMFSSGTGWFRSLVSKNCAEEDVQFTFKSNSSFENKLELDADGLYGWKHTYFTGYEMSRFARNENHHLVILSRDAYTWSHSAFAMRAMMTGNTRTGGRAVSSFPEYIRNNHAYESYPKTRHLQHYYSLAEIGPNLMGGDIFSVRKSLYMQWLSLVPKSARVRFVQYEMVRERTSEVMLDLFQAWNITCQGLSKSTFQDQKFRVKMKKVSEGETTKDSNPRSKICSVMTPDLYLEIRLKLDLDLEEKLLGYTYPETMHEYCEGVPLVPLEASIKRAPPPPPRTGKTSNKVIQILVAVFASVWVFWAIVICIVSGAVKRGKQY